VKSEEAERIILGIDPGTTVTGYGLIKVTGRNPSLITLGIIDLRKKEDHFKKIRTIFEQTLELIDHYHPDEFAIEAPFFGKNVQSMLKLGRAQGAAIAAALYRDLPVFEYAPRMIKVSITGRGQASKEQVAAMLKTIL
jgi:crossover junction endodeoxyribonuclease RuvC